MKENRRGPILVFFITFVVLYLADILSKTLVFSFLEYPSDNALVLIPGWLQFVARINEGGIWSIGAQWGVTMNTFLIFFCSVASVAILAWAFWTIPPRGWLMAVILGAILAGASGNLYDRLVFGGVRDFIEVHYFDVWYFPTFNLADSCLVVGAISLMLFSFFTPSPASASVEPRHMAASQSP